MTTDGGRQGARADRTWLVGIAAALWGTDGLLRLPLAVELPSSSVVFWEHLLVTAALLPFLPRALRALSRCGPREWVAVLVLGGGSSVLATTLFTAAFQVGDSITPLVLQQTQPLFAMLAAFVLLGERLRSGYLLFAAPAVFGSWLLAFDNPLDIQVAALRAALLALAASALWAAATVLGRMLSANLEARDITTLRFAVGLPVAAIIVAGQGNSFAVGWDNALGLALLALIPGLLSIPLYYLGMQTTPAARATLAELAFPATAAVIGVAALGETLSITQWAGLAVVVFSVAALGWHERVRAPVVVTPDHERAPS